MAQTILVVDDDPVARGLIEMAIARSGLTVVTAGGGAAALDILLSSRGETISLMLLDLVMPDVDGFEVLTKLRAVNQELPVIVITAKDDSDSTADAMSAGANGVMVKPFSIENLMPAIQNALKPGVLSDVGNDLKECMSDQMSA